ncbi:hypothetical protein B5S31_g862 [[Candida] boidinii]|nr:hypothetical protein B5S31_g862 [[Candida] boidinii]
MARKSTRRAREPAPEEHGLDEVDSFSQEREKILLDQAGWSGKQDEEESEDSETNVLDIEESDDESEDEEDYKKKFQGPVDEDEEGYFVDGNDDGESEEEGWGASKENYYGADDMDDDDSKEMEAEALKQQKKHLEDLNMDDYMIDEMEDEWKKESRAEEEDNIKTKATNIIDSSVISSDLTTKDQLDLLRSVHPEFIPLSKELTSLRPQLEIFKKSKETNEMSKIKFTALSAYLGTIGVYFALFVSNFAKKEPFSMQEENVMSGILNAREIWRQASSLPDEIPDSVVSHSVDSASASDLAENNSDMDSDSDDNEESELEDNNDSISDDNNDDDEIDFSKRRSIKKLHKKTAEDIDEIDAEEKQGRRKTLRFYTSKIDQQENKKDSKFTGDQDIPYKERLFERQQRLVEEAKKRGDRSNKSAPGVDLGNDDDDFEDDNLSTNNDKDYYDSIVRQKSEGKHSRKEAHELAVKASRTGKLEELNEEIGENGKRALNYQIMKNKGLTAHRKKENRNARVKKRRKYAQAQKKLKSVRAVYKTPSGAYGGETSGIKKNLSKSVKLV